MLDEVKSISNNFYPERTLPNPERQASYTQGVFLSMSPSILQCLMHTSTKPLHHTVIVNLLAVLADCVFFLEQGLVLRHLLEPRNEKALIA